MRMLAPVALCLAACTAPGDSPGAGAKPTPGRFSVFVTSLAAIRDLSGNPDGFGGDLGGLAGADRICQEAAARAGAGDKTWRAFLSVTKGPEGGPVHAILRIGEGPWYDRRGRLVAENREALLGVRPRGNPQAVRDLLTEDGSPLETSERFHDVLTGSNKEGRLASPDPRSTCQDWTTTETPDFEGDSTIMCGHSWPRGDEAHWISAHPVPGCGRGITGVGDQDRPCVGCNDGYGGIYCFALTP